MLQKVKLYDVLIQNQLRKELMKIGIMIGSKLGICWFGATYTAIKLSSGLWTSLILKITDLNEVKMSSLPERALMIRNLPKDSMHVPIHDNLKIMG